MPVSLTTPAGRRISVEAETEARLGRVFYRVAGVGTFTLEHENTRPEDMLGGRLHVMYGRIERLHQNASWELPEDPATVYGVTLCGGWVFDPDDWFGPLDPDMEWRRRHGGVAHRWLGPGRSESAPNLTRRRAVDIVLALARDFLDRADSLALKVAGDAVLAPGRLTEERRTINRLREEIAAREAELAAAMIRADSYLALIPADIEGVTSDC